MTTASELALRLNAKRIEGGFLALCPGHDDTNPSLSIKEKNGKLLLHCFAGCMFEHLRSVLNLESNGNGRQITATYDYRDEGGYLVSQACRTPPKSFFQRTPDGEGGWINKLNGVRRVLYRLPELLAADLSNTVFILEGEKDCERLARLCLVSTTNAGGAGKWRDEYNEALRGRRVAILPDNDEPGRKHAEDVARSVQGVVESVKIVELPNLPVKGDVSDWLDAGGTVDQLRTLVINASVYQPTLLSTFDTPTADDEEELKRLASLPLLEYERARLTSAKTLKCRPATLDKLVDEYRPNKKSELQGRGVKFEEIEPWPEPVIGAEVLADISETLSRYLALPEGAADALTLWCAHAHALDAFDYSPRLNISSPEKRCGKTTARDVVGLFVPKPLPTENLSVAVLFRIIESQKPTLLADECDSYLGDNDELRGMLNAGHKRGGQALRCEGDGNEVRAFNVFGASVLCGIGSLPGTLHDRSIVVRLERAKPGEILKRFDSRHTTRERELARKLLRFVQDNIVTLGNCDPVLPASAYNRVADNWRPLFAIAAAAGGRWPKRLVDAFASLVSTDETDAQGVGVMLLGDIQQVFAEKDTDKLFSQDLVDALCEMTDRPWPEARREKPITPTWLSRRLRPFSILPKSIRIGTDNKKGYELSVFQDAFERYLPKAAIEKDAPQGGSNRLGVTPRINTDENAKTNRHNENACDALKTAETVINTGLCHCDGLKGGTGQSHHELYFPVGCDIDEILEREAIRAEGCNEEIMPTGTT